MGNLHPDVAEEISCQLAEYDATESRATKKGEVNAERNTVEFEADIITITLGDNSTKINNSQQDNIIESDDKAPATQPSHRNGWEKLKA
jgi:lipopolysaccharide export system protein LptA